MLRDGHLTGEGEYVMDSVVGRSPTSRQADITWGSLLRQVKELPPMEQLQTDEATRARWIFYSALDAKATWELHTALKVDCRPACCVQILVKCACRPFRGRKPT